VTALKYWQAVNLALREELERDERVCVFGEDVGGSGGPFGATRGLQDAFGDWRVRDTPISEAVIAGLGVGAAMTGLRPVAEIMFMDFIGLAMDQIVNQAAKVSYMSAGKWQVPLTIRTMCGSNRESGTQHCQSLEAWVAGVPGLKVVWGGTPADARGLLKAAIRDDDPVVVIESVSLWTQRGEVPDDPESLVPIGEGLVRRPGTDLTLVCWGGTVERALAAGNGLAERGIDAEIIDLRTITPMDEPMILTSLAKTGRLLIAQDATGPCSVGSEVARLAATDGYASLRAPVVLLCPPFAPAPLPRQLDRSYYTQVGDIVTAAEKLVAEGST
jgi:acetoin:2,6-dichlorophenolindophenol oxidoreductase subunit beta